MNLSLSLVVAGVVTIVVATGLTALELEPHNAYGTQHLFMNNQTLDLSIDPMNPNGMSQHFHDSLIALGYRDTVLPRDCYFEGVKSKRADGTIYERQGWVVAGTALVYNPTNIENGGGTFRACENQYGPWRAWVRAGY